LRRWALRTLFGLSVMGVAVLALYAMGTDRVEVSLNHLHSLDFVAADEWAYLYGSPYLRHMWPRDGTVRVLGVLDGSLWIVYWVPCTDPRALPLPEGWCDECFAAAYSTDGALSWQQTVSLPEELRTVMNDTFSFLTHETLASNAAIYQKWKKGSHNCLDHRAAGHQEWIGGPCTFDGVPGTRGGFDYLLAVDPSDPLHVFVRKRSGGGSALVGLWESRDGGRTFALIKLAPRGDYVWVDHVVQVAPFPFNFLAIDPADPRRLITDEGGRLILSVDAGKTWADVFPGGAMDNVRPVFAFLRTLRDVRNEFYQGLFDPVVPGRVYVASNLGLLVSVDGGRSWRLANTGGLRPDLTLCAVPEAKAVFVGSRRGLLKSTDGGETWHRINLGFERSWWRTLVPGVPCPQ
jgi:hypothetical protein